MRRHFAKMIVMGLVTGVLGIVLSAIPPGTELEEDLGLHFLFELRGDREPPSDVLIVSMDTESAQSLSLLSKPERWPRSLHASLVQNLMKEGARAIVFDVFFEEPKSPEEDELFARALKESRNVVLCQSLKQDSVPLPDHRGKRSGLVNVERLMPPLPLFTESAVGTAPFPLPKVPVKVSRYWAFKTEAGDSPTLPVVALQVFALDVYDDFIRLLKGFAGSEARNLPPDREDVLLGGDVNGLSQALREIFLRNPGIADRMLSELDLGDPVSSQADRMCLIKALINMYRTTDSLFLNFYGRPGTIRTIPYHSILQGRSSAAEMDRWPDLKGKAVFIGLSQLLRPEQRDGFYTVFSQPSGIDMSGVEIAATAFANLQEGNHVQPLSTRRHVMVVVAWAFLLSLISLGLPIAAAAVCILLLVSGYVAFAYSEFAASAVWYPLVIPILIQSPAAFFGTLWWKYLDTHKDRENIRRAFGHYLPDKVVDEISKGMGGVLASSETVYGTCLSTDGEQYVRLSEIMTPDELSAYMNRYYEAVFRPVRDRGGIISDVVGDSMMAIWASSHPDEALRARACEAALEIADAVDRFNDSESVPMHRLPTRMGLHSGHVSLGSIGGIDHFEYRAVGDVVNTASRIEGLNKLLGTKLLVSREVMEGLEGFLVRELGGFVLAGKSRPAVVFELICSQEKASEDQRALCALFSKGLTAYLKRSWDEAAFVFRSCLDIAGEDGPSRFFLKRCEENRGRPPEDDWDGVYVVARK